MINYYQELNIDPTLKIDELSEILKNAQRKWLVRTNASNLDRRQEAERKVSLIEEAQKILLDNKKRREYDEQIKTFETLETLEKESINISLNTIDSSKLIQEAWKLIELEKYEDAVIIAKSIIKVCIDNSEAWALIGHVNYLQHNIDEAVEQYKKAIKLMSDNDTYYTKLANILLDNNILSEAEEYANKAIELDHNKSDNKFLVANIAAAKKNYDIAISTFEELISEEPDNDSYKKSIANCYYFKGVSYCFTSDNGEVCCIDEQATKKMIECMKKAKKFHNDPKYNEKILWGENALRKVFDKSKWSLFIIPILILFNGNYLAIGLAALVIAVLLYLSIRPQWKLNRIVLLGEKTIYDKCALVFTETVGALFSMIGALIEGLLSVLDKKK